MKIKIKLLSDLCTASGETHNSLIDLDVVYDEYGLPYIPAKRLKGCIREAALEMQELGLVTETQFGQMFGQSGSQKSAFCLSNAYIEGYNNIVSDLNKFQGTELVSQQNVLEQYTYTRTQTAIDYETGVADKNSLRTIRVVKKGIVFEAECSLIKPEFQKLLENAVSIVKHIGVSRTRGLGLVNMELIALDSRENIEKEHVFVKKEALKEQNQLHYTIYLKSPVICKSEQGNQAETKDYIAGNKVLGLIAGALGSASYQEMMSKEDVIVTNAYICMDGERCIPGRISLQKEKDQPYNEKGELMLEDMLYGPDVQDRQMAPAGIDYLDKKNRVAAVDTQISYHHQRPQDKSIGHATGNTEDGSSFYQLCSISAGQTFGGYIYANRQNAERILEAVKKLGDIRMGYGRSSEFGAVDFQIDSVQKVEKKEKRIKEAVLTFVSDTILYNEYGMAAAGTDTLKKYLEEMLDITDLEIRNPFLQYTTIGGYNVTWKQRKPIIQGIEKGSVVLLYSETGFDAGQLEHTFIGERVAEGYGEIEVDKPEEKQVVVYKPELHSGEHQQKELISDIINQLLNAEFERQMNDRIRTKLTESGKTLTKNADVLNAAVSKLRVMVKAEKNYENLIAEIEGIEDTKKRELCRSIVKAVNPKTLTEQICRQLEEKYDVGFELRWNENECYRMAYRNCITELKYLTKMGKGEQ